jgi:hypothetical protein
VTLDFGLVLFGHRSLEEHRELLDSLPEDFTSSSSTSVSSGCLPTR